MNENNETLVTIQPDELVVLKTRKHWFIFLRMAIGTMLVGIVPFLFLLAALATGMIPGGYLNGAILTYISALWLLIVWMALAIIWTNYYLDLWIVTDRRIINVEQLGLFNREVTTWRMERVQEVTIRVRNAFEALLDLGTIEVATAGPTDENAIMAGIPHPGFVQQKITEQVDRFTEEHNAHSSSLPHAHRHTYDV